MDNGIIGQRLCPQIILMACGSFNPPTFMHLRMFEIARDYFQKRGQNVIGGIISPVHDAYGKKELEYATHRVAMLKEAVKDTNWIKVSTWESQQESWSRTRDVLQYHQNQINAIINDTSDNNCNMVPWIPESLMNENNKRKVSVKLLCGGDLLESFAVPGLWANEDIEYIVGEHGLVVISRCGTNSEKFIYDHDVLYHYQHNINLVTEWITNEICSTKIRKAFRRGESVKYLLPDGVIDYVMNYKLYGANQDNTKY